MTFTIHDLVGLTAAAASFAAILLLPGIALAHIADLFAARRLRGAGIYGLGLIVGYAVLPVADSLLSRYLGLGAALIFNLGLAAHGLRVVWVKKFPRPDFLLVAASFAWLLLLIVVWIDFDIGNRLYPSLLMLDGVKHAATVREIVEAGTVPPLDPFFLRDGVAGYYYFYYVLSALVERLSDGFIDQRAAVGGQMFWTALALVALMRQLFDRAGFQKGPLNPALLLAVMAAAGLQIIFVAVVGLKTGVWVAQTNWLNEQVTGWPMSLLWVPQHVASLIACWAGFLSLAEALQKPEGRPSDFRAVAVAGFAFASAAGLSIWVAGGAAAATGIWIALLMFERRWRAVLAIATAGAVSALLFLPDIIDILRFRSFDAPAVAFSVRSFGTNEISPGLTGQLVRLALLPINYLMEFGVLLIGSFLFWRHARPESQDRNEVRRMVTVSALVALVLASFFKSTIVNNDLGWRVILFTQSAALLWTVAALARIVGPQATLRQCVRGTPRLIMTAFVIGWCGVLYDLVALRAFHPLNLTDQGQPRRDPELDHAVRVAYQWLAANTDRSIVMQHNPDVQRVLGYGLYGRSRVGVSDRHNARLFGAAASDVSLRLDDVTPVFSTPMPAEEATRRLKRNQVTAAFVTASDPIWRDKTSWVWTLPPLYTSQHVRVVTIRGAEK